MVDSWALRILSLHHTFRIFYKVLLSISLLKSEIFLKALGINRTGEHKEHFRMESYSLLRMVLLIHTILTGLALSLIIYFLYDHNLQSALVVFHSAFELPLSYRIFGVLFGTSPGLLLSFSFLSGLFLLLRERRSNPSTIEESALSAILLLWIIVPIDLTLLFFPGAGAFRYFPNYLKSGLGVSIEALHWSRYLVFPVWLAMSYFFFNSLFPFLTGSLLRIKTGLKSAHEQSHRLGWASLLSGVLLILELIYQSSFNPDGYFWSPSPVIVSSLLLWMSITSLYILNVISGNEKHITTSLLYPIALFLSLMQLLSWVIRFTPDNGGFNHTLFLSLVALFLLLLFAHLAFAGRLTFDRTQSRFKISEIPITITAVSTIILFLIMIIPLSTGISTAMCAPEFAGSISGSQCNSFTLFPGGEKTGDILTLSIFLMFFLTGATVLLNRNLRILMHKENDEIRHYPVQETVAILAILIMGIGLFMDSITTGKIVSFHLFKAEPYPQSDAVHYMGGDKSYQGDLEFEFNDFFIRHNASDTLLAENPLKFQIEQSAHLAIRENNELRRPHRRPPDMTPYEFAGQGRTLRNGILNNIPGMSGDNRMHTRFLFRPLVNPTAGDLVRRDEYGPTIRIRSSEQDILVKGMKDVILRIRNIRQPGELPDINHIYEYYYFEGKKNPEIYNRYFPYALIAEIGIRVVPFRRLFFGGAILWFMILLFSLYLKQNTERDDKTGEVADTSSGNDEGATI